MLGIKCFFFFGLFKEDQILMYHVSGEFFSESAWSSVFGVFFLKKQTNTPHSTHRYQNWMVMGASVSWVSVYRLFSSSFLRIGWESVRLFVLARLEMSRSFLLHVPFLFISPNALLACLPPFFLVRIIISPPFSKACSMSLSRLTFHVHNFL